MNQAWRKCRLGDVSVIRYGYTAKASADIAGPKFLRITDIQNDAVNWSAVPSCPITSEDFEKHRLQEGDIVFARTGATTGKSYRIIDAPEAVAASYLIRVRITEKALTSGFLELFFKSADYWTQVKTGTIGSAQGGFNASKLAELKILIPPPEEQKHIVTILDEAFAGIETAIANTEKNLANARELFESYADLAVKSLQGVRCRLKDCVEQVSTGPFGSLLHKSDYVSAGVPLVNPINIVDSRIVPDDRKCVAEDTLERLSAYVLKEGDVVVARRGEIGRCAVVEQEQDGWLCGTGCFFVRPTKELNPHFLVNLLRSETGRSELLRRSTGATMKNLGNKALSTFEIRLPPREAQDKAIEQLSDVQNASHDLTQVFRRKLGSLQELKQSLLQKAFSGELTADRAQQEIESATV